MWTWVPVTNYRLAFLGETASTVNLPTVLIDGTDPGINGDEVETFLDMEVLGGIAPKAKINYYASDDSDLSSGLFTAMERAINDNTVSILSASFGECEADAGTSTNEFLSEIYQQAAAQGITITVSSGDSGSAACDSSGSPSAVNGLAVNGLASTPFNIAVGGRTMTRWPQTSACMQTLPAAVCLLTGGLRWAISRSSHGTIRLNPTLRLRTMCRW